MCRFQDENDRAYKNVCRSLDLCLKRLDQAKETKQKGAWLGCDSVQFQRQSSANESSQRTAKLWTDWSK